MQTTKNNTYSQIQSAREKLKDAKIDLQNAEKELEENKTEFNEKINDAEQKLIDARQKISEIENPEWYILDRNSNISYNSFVQDTQNIENIATVFPIVFFIVATLISLTSMTRMVEEQRVQIGTLKALGYNKFQIASKYLIYAALACIIGGILGMCVGFATLPRIIWLMYSMMYTIDEFVVKFDVLYGGIGLILINVCILGATLITVLKELKYAPAELMRPKAPKMGKRVLLERVTFIWKRLSFSRKVTIRNIFRYKKRFLMTIFGICGCTALILTGFGLKDSVSRILSDQYGRINKYNMQITLKSSLEEDQKVKFIQELATKPEIENAVEVNISSGKLNNIDNKDLPEEQKISKEKEVQIIVPKDSSQISKVINILSAKTKKELSLEDGKVYITQKVSQLIGANEGDKILLKDKDDIEKEVEVGGIVENYIYHYTYMTKNTYEQLYGEYSTNTISVTNVENLSKESFDELSKQILERSEVASVMRTDVIESMMDDMMSSLNYVVVVLIISAGLLAFVVLYNLAYVNMSERIRELATIKVLGFYNREVYEYVTRETVLLTIIGIILGLAFGYFLNIFVLSTCELNMLKFSTDINFESYIYSIVITWVFTMIVNLATYFALKKIDMVESLKSIE